MNKNDNADAIGCFALALAVPANGLVTAWLLDHYGVTDQVTWWLVMAAAQVLLLTPTTFAILLAMALAISGIVFIAAPLTWAADWLRRPTYKD